MKGTKLKRMFKQKTDLLKTRHDSDGPRKAFFQAAVQPVGCGRDLLIAVSAGGSRGAGLPRTRRASRCPPQLAPCLSARPHTPPARHGQLLALATSRHHRDVAGLRRSDPLEPDAWRGISVANCLRSSPVLRSIIERSAASRGE
eukprot:166596-Hanusia_phi.AAC.3